MVVQAYRPGRVAPQQYSCAGLCSVLRSPAQSWALSWTPDAALPTPSAAAILWPGSKATGTTRRTSASKGAHQGAPCSQPRLQASPGQRLLCKAMVRPSADLLLGEHAGSECCWLCRLVGEHREGNWSGHRQALPRPHWQAVPRALAQPAAPRHQARCPGARPRRPCSSRSTSAWATAGPT